MQVPYPPVPGRLRLRFTQLKQQTLQLSRMAAALYGVDGVLAVETSPLTGGLLIHYDAVIGKTTAFWDQIEAVLLAHEILLDPRPLGRQVRGGGQEGQALEREAAGGGATRTPARQRPCAGVGPDTVALQGGSAGYARAPGKLAGGGASLLAGKLVESVVDRLVERCAVALVAALL